MGAAIADYFNHRKADKLRVFSSQFEEDEIPMNQLFRPYDEMPELEQISRNIRYNHHADERIGHYREVGKYGSFLSKDETTASPRGMYLDGFQ